MPQSMTVAEGPCAHVYIQTAPYGVVHTLQKKHSGMESLELITNR